MQAVLNNRPSIVSFAIEGLKLDKAYDNIRDLFSIKKKTTNETVKLVIVNECLFPGNAAIPLNEHDRITVVYDKESLDSLYGLSFFKYVYGDHVQAIAYQNVTADKKEILSSKETIILGVDLPMDDLAHLDSISDNVRVFSYRGTFNYLYDKSTHSRFSNVTLYMSDYGFNIGGEGIEHVENTVAMLLKIMYFDGATFTNWPQYKLAMTVAHAAAFYPMVPDYNLTRSTIVFNDQKNNDLETRKSQICNHTGALLMDFRNKLEAAASNLDLFGSIWTIQPNLNITDYSVRRNRIADHVTRTSILQSWRHKGRTVTSNTIPAFSHDVCDVVELATVNKHTVVCVEDAGLCMNYYVFSKTPGRATEIAKVINGETSWKRGLIHCVSKRKDKDAQR